MAEEADGRVPGPPKTVPVFATVIAGTAGVGAGYWATTLLPEGQLQTLDLIVVALTAMAFTLVFRDVLLLLMISEGPS